MFKYILFDLDDTILNFKAAERRALILTLKKQKISFNDDILSRYNQLNIKQWKLLEKGLATREQVKVNRFKELFVEFGIDAIPEETTALYENFLAEGHIFMDGAKETLEILYPDYSLYLVSNGTLSVQRGRIASADIAKYFKGIYVSQEVGYEKPTESFFKKVFSLANICDLQSTAIVGDSLTSDILGGINAGITTIWFNPENKINDENILPNYTIGNLRELPKLLSK